MFSFLFSLVLMSNIYSSKAGTPVKQQLLYLPESAAIYRHFLFQPIDNKYENPFKILKLILNFKIINKTYCFPVSESRLANSY